MMSFRARVTAAVLGFLLLFSGGIARAETPAESIPEPTLTPDAAP